MVGTARRKVRERQADRQRVKVVAVTGSWAWDPTGDRDAETRWCSDFSRLQMQLKKDGTDLVIEKALGVGTVALAEVSSVEIDEENREVAARDRSRTL